MGVDCKFDNYPWSDPPTDPTLALHWNSQWSDSKLIYWYEIAPQYKLYNNNFLSDS